MEISLYNKNILLTGASRGIGRAIALALGDSGARLALHYNSSSTLAFELAEKTGNGSFAIQADLGNAENAGGLFYSALEKMGRIDVLINNAGIAMNSPISSGNKEWLSDLRKTLEVNLAASSLLCKMAVNHFIPLGGGIIINISSRAAFRGDTAEYIAYAASKGGIVSLTKSIAKEFGKNGITAFNIAPGFVRTDMANDFLEEYGEDHLLKDLALKNITKPEDLAPLIVFLASGMGEHATGTTIDVNAGSYLH
jgi:NAD(P)-dependent dehydrogenase (short-subunit alcohol dehydrogenase family)